MKGFHWETYNISRYVFLYSYSYPYVFYVLRRFEAIPKGYKSHSGSSYQWKVFFFLHTHTLYSNQHVSFCLWGYYKQLYHHSWPCYLHKQDRCTEAPTDVKQILAHVHIHSLHPDFPSPSCAAVLRPCILMALMVLHAALRSLKVNSLTSAVSWLRVAVIDRPAQR